MNLMKYVEQAYRAIDKAYAEYEAALMTKDTANQRISDKAKNDSSYTHIDADEDARKAQEAFEASCSSIWAACNDVIEAARAGFADEVRGFYKPDGAKIDENAQKLLRSGIKLNLSEICDMVIEYSENPTMLRIFNDYVNANNYKDIPEPVRRALIRAAKGGAEELKTFEHFIAFSIAGLTFSNISALNANNERNYIYYQRQLEGYLKEAEVKLMRSKLYLSPDDLKAIAEKEREQLENFQDINA